MEYLCRLRVKGSPPFYRAQKVHLVAGFVSKGCLPFVGL